MVSSDDLRRQKAKWDSDFDGMLKNVLDGEYEFAEGYAIALLTDDIEILATVQKLEAQSQRKFRHEEPEAK